MDPQQQFCLKWNSYSSNLASTFSNLFKSDLLADVTLSCDGVVFKAHKLILAACSKKFADLFENTPTNGQCVVILEATSSNNMAALLEFMYKGEVHVSQEALNSFLKSAENLQVKGLSTETGRLAAQQAQTPLLPPAPHQQQQQQHLQQPHNIDTPPLLDSPSGRRSIRNSISGGNMIGAAAACGGNSVGCVVGNTPNLLAGSGLGCQLGNNNNGGNNNSNNPSGSIGVVSAHHLVIAGAGIGVSSGNKGGLKQECEPLMHPGSMSPYVPPIYRLMSFEPLRKRALRSPYAEQEVRGSVLRDGSKNSSECASPISKPPYHRPSSSASSTAPTEPETMPSERASPSSRYENHSPNNPTGSSSAPTRRSLERSVKSERNKGSAHDGNDDERDEHDESIDNGAEDLRVKMENSSYSRPPSLPAIATSVSPTTPTGLLENLKNVEAAGLQGSLAESIAPADMLNVWNATKLNNKNRGLVNTADGKKLKCLFCDRLYGYETNLRAHIRQRHQNIRVHCPFCSRTFTRNNTVRRHIAREHKQEIGINASSTIAPASAVAAAAAAAAKAAAANHSQ